MNPIKVFWEFSRKEQIAILFLLVLLLMLSLLAMLSGRFIHPPTKTIAGLSDSISFAAEYLAATETKRKETTFDYSDPDRSVVALRLHPFPFNPNQLPEEQWRKLGLKEYQIKNILNYERSGGKFKRKEDFAKLYTISEEEFAILEPFIVIPAPEKPTAVNENDTFAAMSTAETADKIETPVQPIDLNSADSVSLIQIPNIGPWFAHRIIKYRKILGGYTNASQLLEVHGMDSIRYSQIAPFLLIDSSPIEKIKINHLEFKELLRHPYLDFEQVKAIMNHRNRRGFIQTDVQLAEIAGMLPQEISRLNPYIDFD